MLSSNNELSFDTIFLISCITPSVNAHSQKSHTQKRRSKKSYKSIHIWS